VIDTGVRRELAASAYNERRQQCEGAVKLLRELLLEDEPDNVQLQNIQTLRDVTPAQFTLCKDRLPKVLQRRAGYIIAENERVLQVVHLLEQGQIEQAGAILWQGHAGLRDEYEVSCAELDALVEIARQVSGVFGARMMGGGFGGCTINLVRNDAVEWLRRLVEQDYPQRCGRMASVDICCAAAGPGYMFVG
jgi:galactokinase